MKNCYLILSFFFLLSEVVTSQNKEIQPYVDFLKEQQTNPVDYVFKLFEKYDVVVLQERDHRDTTQYELFDKIISDLRFIKNVGNVFTEVGVSNQTEAINKVLKADYPSQEIFEDSLRGIYREMDYMIMWDKYNYWQFLKNLHKVNRSLSEEEKINYYPSDTPFDWASCKTRTEMKCYLDYIWGFTGSEGQVKVRDSIMGMHVANEVERIQKTEKRKKALVILNSPHAMPRTILYRHKKAAAYIFEKHLGKVVNVFINWIDFCNEKDNNIFIQGGKWDAAFKYLNNPVLGFDLQNSPFGRDTYDVCIGEHQNGVKVKYQDLYNGFIFYKPVDEWKLMIGIPGIVTEEFLPELKRRTSLYDPDSRDEGERLKEYYNTIREVPIISLKDPYFLDIKDLNKYIDRWLGK